MAVLLGWALVAILALVAAVPWVLASRAISDEQPTLDSWRRRGGGR